MTNSTHLWHPLQQARLLELLREQLSASVIAGKLSKEFHIQLTRCAIIGKTRRLGELLPGNRKSGTRTQTKDRARKYHRKPVAPPKIAVAPLPPEPLFPAPVAARLPVGDQCHWPIGDPTKDGFGYCNHVRMAGKPYCVSHCNVAYGFTKGEHTSGWRNGRWT